MNLGLVISYIIAGMIMLSIIMMNISVSQSATELTITQITREKASTVTELISHDLQKMGYNCLSKTPTIINVALGHKIQFYSNINNSCDPNNAEYKSIETITWEYDTSDPSNEIEATLNPDDYVLMRTVEYESGVTEETPIELGVTQFRISYYDNYGEPVADSLATPVTTPANIRQLYIKIGFESAEKIYNRVGDDGRYILSVWEKRFSPANLESTQ